MEGMKGGTDAADGKNSHGEESLRIMVVPVVGDRL